ncbi:MAG TPA: ATP synthase F0 subunit B [Bacteriovoracaceae bacterium]|nr:ATP synthase F0 subunit B [Bacteriovoracaceae bacterium]
MRFWTAYTFMALGIATKAWSSGDGAHHGSAADLIAPAVNVAILAGLLIWKLKGPLKSYFDKQADEVSNTLERASLKTKEAQMMMENEKRKLANLQQEVKQINAQSETDVLYFEKNLSKETEEKTHKLKTDANSKIQADKKAMMDELNAQLLDQVISQAKQTIKTNKEYQSKASAKLLKGL